MPGRRRMRMNLVDELLIFQPVRRGDQDKSEQILFRFLGGCKTPMV